MWDTYKQWDSHYVLLELLQHFLAKAGDDCLSALMNSIPKRCKIFCEKNGENIPRWYMNEVAVLFWTLNYLYIFSILHYEREALFWNNEANPIFFIVFSVKIRWQDLINALVTVFKQWYYTSIFFIFLSTGTKLYELMYAISERTRNTVFPAQLHAVCGYILIAAKE